MKYLNNEWVFLGLIAGIIVSAFYDVQIVNGLSALISVIGRL